VKPAVDHAFLERLWRYRDTPGNSVGGNLHLVIDDGNVCDGHVQACALIARIWGDVEGEALAMILLQMSKTQRRKAARHFYDH
jgi:hypothetical protein